MITSQVNTTKNQELDTKLPPLKISEKIVLSGQDAIKFLELLENAPSPSQNLKNAADKFRKNNIN